MRITYLLNRVKGSVLNDRDEAYFYNTANQLFNQMRATFDTTPNYRNVLGLRKFTPVTKEYNKGLYDDSIWVLWVGRDKVKHATEYEGNTEPSYWYFGKDGQNANPLVKVVKGQPVNPNLDDIKDLGRLPTGVYRYSTIMLPSEQLGMHFRLTQSQRIERDINHDGDFTDEDVKLITNQSAMKEGRTMHFHKGGSTRTGSAGCQTLPPTAWQKFIKDIGEGRQAGQSEFTYVLINKG